ncbi:hypothetical protein JTB14_005089 [Gonioctena quinquepunctata]|nr:hypothetical protein JTB14_005089 [Gonioctena quinquepunctata]
MNNLIYWNCNGCKHHYPEIKEVITKNNPFCICLQETHFKSNENFQFRGFKSYRKDAVPDQRARGGVAIFIRENIPHRAIPLQSPLEVVAIEISYPFKMSICDIYLPDSNWTVEDLRNIINQLPQPFLIMGDFNAHNPIWGSERLDASGRKVEKFLEETKPNIIEHWGRNLLEPEIE